ncbi:MAG: glycosyltransferase family 2 protein [Firmicutes bacterium]|nr:glycosyltransferase family 2 protein [Bacillota bacterium]
MNELVSIVMPSFNTGTYINETIKSVLSQTYGNWELIIVDDCSTDNSDKIIREYLVDQRIRYFKNENNSGAAVSRNRALREARGRWIAFLDSDDLWAPEKLEAQIEYMEENHYSFSYTDYMIKYNGTWLPYIYTGPNVVNRRRMYNYCYIFTSTVIYDRNKIGLIQIENLKKNNDYAMWLQVIEKSNCYRFPRCMSYYIKHDDSISGGSKFKLIKWHYKLFRDGLHKGIVVSIIFTLRNLIFGIIKKVVYKEKTNVIPNI